MIDPIKKEFLNKLRTAIKTVNKSDSTKFNATSYSGRFMYGEQCLGIDVPQNHDISILALEIGKPYKQLGEPRKDNMGKGMIYYWPSYSLNQDEAAFLDAEASDHETSEEAACEVENNTLEAGVEHLWLVCTSHSDAQAILSAYNEHGEFVAVSSCCKNKVDILQGISYKRSEIGMTEHLHITDNWTEEMIASTGEFEQYISSLAP